MNSSNIFKQAFNKTRDPRSEEYRRGVLAALKFRCEGITVPQPFRIGSVQFDAFVSGLDEGHLRWRNALGREGK